MVKAQDIEEIKSKVIQSALTLAAGARWDEVSMCQIADKAGIPLDEITPLFADKTDILQAYGRKIDADVAQAMNGQSMEDDTPRDRLFDILMERFDVLNDDRASVVSILDSMTLDPKQMVISLPWLCRSMTSMLELSNVETSGWKGALRITGLTGVYLKTLRVWVNDESQDMAVTMASLDTALNRADQMASYFKI
ncbi:MAG: TetR family transcriptional regulator [Alphaproteobacteria bacterium]|nr:MAG: TetR family transcriptional regulator [Alphaproteobacteria bacterium]